MEPFKLAGVELTKDIDASDEQSANWQGSLLLDDWLGYVSHLIDQCAPDEQQPLSAPVELRVMTTDDMPLNHLGQQSVALEQFVAQQQTIQKKMLLEIWKMFVGSYDSQYDELFSASESSELISWEERTRIANNPTEADLAKLKTLIGPYAVNVYPTDGEIPVQIIMEFGCWWDPEHGLEVLVEQGEIKDVDNVAATDYAALAVM